MNNDMGIAYMAQLKEIKDNIKTLEGVSLNMDAISQIVGETEENVEKEVEKNYEEFPERDCSLFLHDSMESTYHSAEMDLYHKNNDLVNEWDLFYQITKTQEYIEEVQRITVNKNNQELIEELSKEIISLLEKLSRSKTENYRFRADFIERIYDSVYEIMKLELVLTNKDTILEEVKSSSISTTYVVERLRHDIEKTEDEDIQLLVKKLEKEGLDKKLLLNKKLITLLTIYGNDTLKEERKEEFLKESKEWEDNHEKLQQNEKKLLEEKKRQKKYQDEKDYYQRKIHKRRLIIALNGILVSIGLTAGTLGLRELTKQKEYLTTIKTYDSSTDSITEEEAYLPGKKDSITLTEYSPWDTPGYVRDEYERNVYTYTLKDNDKLILTEVEDAEIYLEEIAKEDIEFKKTVETTKETPTDLGYSENKYILKENIKDLNTFQKKVRNDRWILSSVLLSAAILGLDYYLWYLFAFNSYAYKSLKSLKDSGEEAESRLKEENDSIRQLDTSMIQYKVEDERLSENLMDIYEILPKDVQEEKEIQKVYQKIKK